MLLTDLYVGVLVEILHASLKAGETAAAAPEKEQGYVLDRSESFLLF